MSEEPRYTRAEWEEIEREEWRWAKRESVERGDVIVSLHYLARDRHRQTPEQRIALLDAKLAQLREDVLRRFEALEAEGR